MNITNFKIKKTQLTGLIVALAWIVFSTYFCFVVFEKNHINDEIIKAKKDLISEINHSRDLIDDQIRMLKEQPLLISQTPSINQVLIKKK